MTLYWLNFVAKYSTNEYNNYLIFIGYHVFQLNFGNIGDNRRYYCHKIQLDLYNKLK